MDFVLKERPFGENQQKENNCRKAFLSQNMFTEKHKQRFIFYVVLRMVLFTFFCDVIVKEMSPLESACFLDLKMTIEATFSYSTQN